MAGNSGQVKALIAAGAISAPASTALANLLLDPAIGLTPYYIVILGFGFVFFVLAIGVFFEQKPPFTLKECAWNILSIGIAGFVFVSWARYQSLIWSIIAAVVVFASILAAVLHKRKDIHSGYKKGSILVYVGLFAVMVLPVATVAQNIGQPPQLFLTPNPTEIEFDTPNVFEQNSIITVSAVYGNTWKLTIYANASNPQIYPHLNGKMSPVEYEFLERGRDVNMSLLTKISEGISDGVYTIALKYTYDDWLSQKHEGTQLIWVFVNLQPSPTPVPTIEPGDREFTIPANIIITLIAIVAELSYYGFVGYSKLRNMASSSTNR